MTNFYRNHLFGYAQIAEPLYKLTRGSHLWVWDGAITNTDMTLFFQIIVQPMLILECSPEGIVQIIVQPMLILECSPEGIVRV